ncbi:MAG: hypothetical protein JRI25_01700 [Deltaproteobacteria bacterium]|nr:hypothetical protein [Deltaproteobacteria bacterium]
MRSVTACALILCGLVGCVRDLPGHGLGDDARLVFRDFDDDPAALPGIVDRMDAALDALDLEGKQRDRMFDLPELTADFFSDVDVPTDIDTSAQMRASLAALSRQSLDDNLAAQAEENQTCINADSVKCHERLAADETNAADFLDATDDVYRTDNTIRIQTIVLDFWLQAPVDFRRVTLPDGRAAAVSRTWLTEGFNNDGGGREWRQRFGVDLFIEDPDDSTKTRRYYATWLGPSVGGIPGWFAEPAIRSGLDDGFTNPDDWVDDPTCDVVLSECLAESPF